MNQLIAHIQKINAETQAWINQDPKNRCAGLLVDEPEHWARYGVNTVDQFEHYMAATDYYESYKEKYGIRPNWSQINAMTTSQILDSLAKL
jgi:hypothetical protein